MITLLNGDALQELRKLPDESVQCGVTSPPYFGLRDYGVPKTTWADGSECCLGMEKTPAEYIAHLMEIMEECRRVLRNDGTFWLNLGDSSAASGRGGGGSLQGGDAGKKVTTENQRRAPVAGSCLPAGLQADLVDSGAMGRAWVAPPAGFKQKDLLGMPWRAAFACQAAGWYLRQDIIWHKPNAMPESVTDRPTRAHEYIFLLSKSAKYLYDAIAIAEPCESGESDLKKMREARPRIGGRHKDLVDSLSKANSETNIGQRRSVGNGVTRNKRSVWTVGTAVYKDAHFATFPPALIKPCVMAGSRPGDIVLDPFGGSGTTGQVAIELGRKAILVELNPAYCEMIRQRCTTTVGLGI